jgi:hypothetical protein
MTIWRLGTGIWATVGALESRNLFVFNRRFGLSLMFYALGTALDLTISISLCYLLAKHRKMSLTKWVPSVGLLNTPVAES